MSIPLFERTRWATMRSSSKDQERSSPPPVMQDFTLSPDHAPNPQLESPLFNGRIPPEIRQRIMEFSLTEYTKTDPDCQYPLESNSRRPGYTGNRTLTIALLQTCKRVYIENRHLPPQLKEHVFWHFRQPSIRSHIDEVTYFGGMKSWQLDLVKEVHMFVQLFWLEDKFPALCKEKCMQGIERLRLTVRRGDWWWNETNRELGINPARGNGEAPGMTADWARGDGKNVVWLSHAWGSSFKHLASLKELELELEVTDDKLPELETIMKYARKWRFPMGDGKSLDIVGEERREWRAYQDYWTVSCPYCRGWRACFVTEEGILRTKCQERLELKRQRLGPMCTIRSLKYRLQKA